MEELKKILLEHAKRYPLMQPTDAVKLIYQNEFGGGHLIKDEEACIRYLQNEYAGIEKNMAMPKSEYIGNGISRVNLAALEESELEQLGQDFIRSAAIHKGSKENFQSKLAVLTELAEQGAFAFDGDALADYLAEYAAMGYPAVSHSEAYRKAYRPAYRVVLTVK